MHTKNFKLAAIYEKGLYDFSQSVRGPQEELNITREGNNCAAFEVCFEIHRKRLKTDHIRGVLP